MSRFVFVASMLLILIAACSPEKETVYVDKIQYVDRVVNKDSLIYVDRVQYRDSVVYRDRDVIKYIDRVDYITTQISKNEHYSLTITDVAWEFKPSDYLPSLSVTGKARNTGSYTIDYGKIHVKSYRDSTTLISEDYTYLDNTKLAPGAETTWKLSDYDCKTLPNRVAIGYSFSADIIVGPAKTILNP